MSEACRAPCRREGDSGARSEGGSLSLRCPALWEPEQGSGCEVAFVAPPCRPSLSSALSQSLIDTQLSTRCADGRPGGPSYPLQVRTCLEWRMGMSDRTARLPEPISTRCADGRPDRPSYPPCKCAHAWNGGWACPTGLPVPHSLSALNALMDGLIDRPTPCRCAHRRDLRRSRLNRSWTPPGCEEIGVYE